MKRFALIFIALLFINALNIHSQSFQTKQYCELVTNTLGSFLDNPFHHDNTVKVKALLDQQKKVGEEMRDAAWNYNQHGDIPYYNNSLKLIKTFCIFIDVIERGGYGSPSVDNTDMVDIVDPILKSFGWEKSLLCFCQYIEIYQYKKDNFKMTMVKNTRPYDWTGFVSYKIYHIDPFSKKMKPIMTHLTSDGTCQFLNYKDDSSKFVYHAIKKVESRIGSDTKW